MAKLTKSKLFQLALLLIFFISFFSLSGCGGSKETTTTGTTTPTAVDHSSLTLSTPFNFVTYGTPLAATATLRDAHGVVVPGAVVTFAQDSNHLVAFDPASATALTNGSGIAHISVNAAAFDSAGATDITASASIDIGGTLTAVISAPVGISVGGALVSLGAITLGSPSISAYGTTSVSIPVYIDTGGGPVLTTIPIQVAFSSTCVGLGKATITTPVTTILGTATSTYKDNGCGSGTDIITASVTGATAGATITVIPPAANNIQFISATPTTIGILGSSLPQSSLVKFQVVDASNNAVAGQLVDFSLLPLSLPGGVTLSAPSATSDAGGFVTVSVNTGTVPTPVWVLATLDSNPAIASQSNTLTITTGMPTQNFFSLGVQTFNIEGLSHDNVTSTLTIIASDRLGNPVPDGTAINFITPVSGQILPATCSTTSGTCTVTYKSSGSRPLNGRLTLLAYAVGEKTFIDTGGYGDNSYHAGDTFYDLGDLYIDANENGQWDPGEESFAPYASGSGGSSVCTEQPSGNLLIGDYGIHGNIPSKVTFVDPLAVPPVPATGTCTGTWETNYVRRSAVIVLSGSSPTISPTTVTMGPTCRKRFDLLLTDINGNPMPAGTTVNTANNNVLFKAAGSSSYTLATVSIINGTPVVNTPVFGGTLITLLVDGGLSCMGGTPPPAVVYPAGDVDIVVKAPLGLTTYTNITVNP